MSTLPDHVKIETEGDFWRFLALLRQEVVLGELVQVAVVDACAVNADIFALERGQVWPGDFMHWQFEDRASGARYDFTLETYHGSGAMWRKLEDGEER